MNSSQKEREYYKKVHQEYGEWAHINRVSYWLFDMQEKFLMNKERLTDQEKEILRMMNSLIPKDWY